MPVARPASRTKSPRYCAATFQAGVGVVTSWVPLVSRFMLKGKCYAAGYFTLAAELAHAATSCWYVPASALPFARLLMGGFSAGLARAGAGRSRSYGSFHTGLCAAGKRMCYWRGRLLRGGGATGGRGYARVGAASRRVALVAVAGPRTSGRPRRFVVPCLLPRPASCY